MGTRRTAFRLPQIQSSINHSLHGSCKYPTLLVRFPKWLTDAEPITSGYRLQLIYDLHQSQTLQKTTSPRPSALHVSQQISQFQDLLRQWTKLSHGYQGPSLLVYIVGDELGDYKRLPLSCAALKNADKQKLLFLQRQCPREGVRVYLAKLITSIDYDTAIDNEVSNTTMELQKIIDLDGHVLVKEKVMIGEANLLREDWFQDRATNDSFYETLESSEPWKEEDSRSNESPLSRTGSSCCCPRLNA